MRNRRSKPALPRLSRDAERLVALAQGLNASGSRVEDGFWESRLDVEVSRLLDNGAEVALETALDVLHATLPPAYEVLIDEVEAYAESCIIERDGVRHRALLVAAPMLAWSRYSIASGALRGEPFDSLCVHLRAHVGADGTHVAVAPYLYSIDQLPRSYSEMRALLRALGKAALDGVAPTFNARRMPETAPLLSDARYLLAAFVAPEHAPLFRWQDIDAAGKPAQGRDQTLEQWRAQGHPNAVLILPGCSVDLLLPDAFHSSLRESDRLIRPCGITAALALLDATLATPPAGLRAVVAAFGTDQVDEYRIGLTKKNSNEVVHGVVWPLFGREEGPEPGGPLEQIETLLRSSGVTEVIVLDELFPLEFCEDCGAPLFADPGGDLVHVELPEEADGPRTHLH